MKKGLLIGISSFVVIALAVTLFVLVFHKKEEPTYVAETGKLIISNDSQKIFYVGDEFIPPIVTLLNPDGSYERLSDPKELLVTGYDMTNAGTYTVDVVLNREEMIVSSKYDITVYSTIIDGLKVESKIDELVWGKKIKEDDLIVTAHFDDGHNEVINDYSLGYNNEPNDYGEIEVLVLYDSFKVSFSLNVVGKTLDDKYAKIENEAKEILKNLGVTDPSCPRDYKLKNEGYGYDQIVFDGDFDEIITTEEEAYAFLSGEVFKGYKLDGDITETTEKIFLSKKVVLINEEKQIRVTVYVTRLLGKNKYSVVIEDLNI